jgi:hypothetical protein
MAKHKGECSFQQSKRGAFEVCSRQGCNERFPCAGNDCGHLDCIEVRGKPPKCHFCSNQVKGLRGEDWGTGLVHGHTRAFDYSCRDGQAPAAEPGEAA